MTAFQRGQKSSLAELNLHQVFPVTLDLASGAMNIDASCFGLDANGKLADERFMVFFNQSIAPDNAVELDLGGGKAVFRIDLARVPSSIARLVFTAAAEQGAMRALGPSSLTLGQPAAASFAFSGADFQDEQAVIIGELYRRDGTWRFGAVGQGFAGGLAALLKHFGGTEAEPVPISAAAAPAAAAKKISLSKITLEKRGDKVSLDKRDSQSYGRIRINLNWNQGQAPARQDRGFMGKLFSRPVGAANGVDLDIGCLFEMRNGAKGAVQALGNSWGAYEQAPYIQLEADDRTGNIGGGENLYINGAHFDQIKRVLVYAFIYRGVPNWAATDGVVTLDIPGQPPVEVRLDNGVNHQGMCAIAMLDNHGGNLQVTKLVEYFGSQGKVTAHQQMDQRHGFGLHWAPGKKD
ncbi:MAG TPA: TerD family protein [Janthinobacterium sp.]|jgi:tellurite resistance protein TerA|nr:TerD family protein [Janthinobacterium sp.]